MKPWISASIKSRGWITILIGLYALLLLFFPSLDYLNLSKNLFNSLPSFVVALGIFITYRYKKYTDLEEQLIKEKSDATPNSTMKFVEIVMKDNNTRDSIVRFASKDPEASQAAESLLVEFPEYARYFRGVDLK